MFVLVHDDSSRSTDMNRSETPETPDEWHCKQAILQGYYLDKLRPLYSEYEHLVNLNFPEEYTPEQERVYDLIRND